MWNNGVFEVAHASGVGRRVRAIEGNIYKGNGARRLKQGCREKGSRVRRRTRLGGKDEKDKKEGGGVLLRISNSRSGTFQAWTERSPYSILGSKISYKIRMRGDSQRYSDWRQRRLQMAIRHQSGIGRSDHSPITDLPTHMPLRFGVSVENGHRATAESSCGDELLNGFLDGSRWLRR